MQKEISISKSVYKEGFKEVDPQTSLPPPPPSQGIHGQDVNRFLNCLS